MKGKIVWSEYLLVEDYQIEDGVREWVWGDGVHVWVLEDGVREWVLEDGDLE